MPRKKKTSNINQLARPTPKDNAEGLPAYLFTLHRGDGVEFRSKRGQIIDIRVDVGEGTAEPDLLIEFKDFSRVWTGGAWREVKKL